jgi:hypothetical protein
VELDLAVWSFILGSSIGEIGGIHPHGDRKSAEVSEDKGVAERPLHKSVRKGLEVKELNEVKDVEEVSPFAKFALGKEAQARRFGGGGG